MDERKEAITELERENQRLRELLASLDEIPRSKRARTVNDLKGMSDVNTGVSKGIHSISKVENGTYLELYLLQRERERLAEETVWLKKRRLRVGRRLADIDTKMADKEEQLRRDMKILQGEAAARAGSPETRDDTEKAQGQAWSRVTIEY